MRISSYQVFDTGARQILNSQSQLFKTQNQLATGKRILSPQDDPVAAAQILLDTQSKEVNLMLYDNQKNAGDLLALEEDRLNGVVENILASRTNLVAARNGSYADNQRAAIAAEMQARLDAMIGAANTTDSSGHYLFSGYQGDTQPFQKVLVNGEERYQYFGDQGQRVLQVGASRYLPVSDSGHDIFERIKTGNGTFASTANTALTPVAPPDLTNLNATNPIPPYPATAKPTNTGSGVVDQGWVTDPQAWQNNLPDRAGYSVVFSHGGNFYSVIETTSGNPIAGGANVAYSPGAAITAIPGATFTITGTPQVGDTFKIAPSEEKPLFQAMQESIDALKTPIDNDTGAVKAAVQNVLIANMSYLDRAQENISSVQSSIGARRQEAQMLQTVAQDVDVDYASKISRLEDLDWAKAISDFMSQQAQLQAAQNSFGKISGMSLFNYL